MDINGDGRADAGFDRECGFLLQLRNGRVVAVEADRDTGGVVQGRKVTLRAFEPKRW